MYAIVHKDKKGFFTWYREPEKFETAENAKIVGVYKGQLQEIVKKAEEFIKANRDKPVKSLSANEISYLLN